MGYRTLYLPQPSRLTRCRRQPSGLKSQRSVSQMADCGRTILLSGRFVKPWQVTALTSVDAMQINGQCEMRYTMLEAQSSSTILTHLPPAARDCALVVARRLSRVGIW